MYVHACLCTCTHVHVCTHKLTVKAPKYATQPAAVVISPITSHSI